MKRKLLIVLLVVISCFACAFGVASCKTKPDNGQGNVQTPPDENPDDTEKPSVIAVSDVSLNKTSLSLRVDENQTLIATVKPSNATNKTVTWKSSDSTVAKVINGKVTALKAGTATITATAGGKSATCTVTVIKTHTHALTKVSAKAADCEIAGNKEYYTCACGKWFADANAKTEITDKSTVTIKATGHKYSTKWTYDETQHWHAATCKHTTLTTTKQNHTFGQWVIDSPATTTSKGAKSRICTVCKYKETESIDKITFVVTWKNYDGTVLKTDSKVPFGLLPSYTGSTPLKNSDSIYNYQFSGWSPDVVEVTEDAEYIAQFTAQECISYTVKYNANGGQNAPAKQTKNKDTNITLSDIVPTNADYAFIGWYCAYNNTTYNAGSTFSVNANVTLYAVWGHTCETCEGKGRIINNWTCSGCSGSGYRRKCNSCGSYSVKQVISGYGSYYQCNSCGSTYTSSSTCSWCSGKGGGTNTYNCNSCNGVGAIKEKAADYSISLMDDNSSVGTASISYNTPYKLIVPTKLGYSFSGWYDSKVGGNQYTDSVGVSLGVWKEYRIKTLYAQWKLNNYSITYDCDEYVDLSGLSQSYTVEDNSIDLPNQTRNGYTFVWQIDSQTVNCIDTQLAKDITVKGIWTPIEYSITYNLNGGSATNPTKYTIETGEIKLRGPAKNGYTFIGWTGSNGKVPQKDVIIPAGNTENLSYTANWELNVYDITYELNGGTNDANNPTSYTVEDANITLKNPDKQHYTFVGWKCNGSSISTISVNQAKDVTVTAIWKPVEYSITYNLDGGTTTNPTLHTIESEDIILSEPAKNGYTFIGWTGSNGEVPKKSVTIPTGNTEHLTYSASWELNVFKVTYELNGGVNNTLNPDTYTVENADITLKNPDKQHYMFVGWECNGSPISTILVNQAKDITVTAIWKPVEYSITYNLDGGTATNPTSHTVESAEIVLIEPIKNGYTFFGWTGSNGEVPKKSVTIPASNTENLIYTANWELTVFNITYILNGGSNAVKNPSTYTTIDTIELKEGAKKGYTFEGWFTDEKFTTQLTALYGQYRDLILYAKFTPSLYSSTFYTCKYTIDLIYWEGSELNQSIELTNGEQFDPYSLSEPQRSGYVFMGWFLDANFTNSLSNSIVVDKNLRLYAQWIEKALNAKELSSSGVYVEAYRGYENTGPSTGYIQDSTSTPVKSIYFYVPFNYVGSNNTMQSTLSCTFRYVPARDYSLSTSGRVELRDLTLNRGVETINSYSDRGTKETDVKVSLVPGHSYQLKCVSIGTLTTDRQEVATVEVSAMISGVVLSQKSASLSIPFYACRQIYDAETATPNVYRRGYDLAGWYDEDNQKITDVWNYTSDKIFYADWKLHNYSLNYVLNGGINDATNPVCYTMEDDPITLAQPVRMGYTFDGWYTVSDFKNRIAVISGSDCTDYTLYAKWVANNYTVTLDYDGGQNCPTIKFYSEGNLVKEHVLFKDSTLNYFVPNNSNKNYVFGGWYIDSELTQLFDYSGTIDTDLTLYAKWVDVSNTSFVSLGSDKQVEINGNAYKYLAIVLPTAQTVTISSSSGLDLYGEIYNSEMGAIASCDDISDDNLDFSITVTLEAGRIYYIGYKANQATITGTASIMISEAQITSLYLTGDYTEEIYTVEVTFDEAFTLPTPKKDGFLFCGWYDANDNLIDMSSWQYDEDITLIAKWSEVI